MNVFFAASLHHLRISSDLGNGDKIDEVTHITNNKKVIANLIDPAYVPIIGSMEAASFLGRHPVVYAKETIDREITPEQYLVTKLYHIQAFVSMLWLYIDNSVNSEIAFLFYGDGPPWSASSNFLAVRFSNCYGEFEETTVSREELRKVRKLYRASVALPDRPFERKPTRLGAGTDRLSSAVSLTQIARSERNLALRVAHYCTALEMLFATSQGEIAHQLSERVACILDCSAEKRIRTYQRVKQAYEIRSSVTHGSTLKGSQLAGIKEISRFCDTVLRRILHRILIKQELRSEFEQAPEAFDKFMLKTIFGSVRQ